MNETLQFSGGVAYDSAFGGDDVFVVGGVRWDPSPRFSLQLVLPEPVVLWKPADRLLLFAHLYPSGGKWNIHDDDNKDDVYSLRVESWRSGAGFEVLLFPSVWFHFACGMDFDRTYKIEDDDEKYLLDSEVDDTWYTRVGLMLR